MKRKSMRLLAVLLAAVLLLGQAAFAEDAPQTKLARLESIMDTLAPSFAQASDEWSVLDMAAYAAYSGKSGSETSAIASYVDNAIAVASKSDASASELAKAVLALKAAGYDAKKLVTVNRTKLNAAAKLARTSPASYYDAPWVLAAQLQGNVGLSKSYIRSAMTLLLSNVGENGIYTYSYEWDGVVYSGDDIDTTGAVLAALAPYYGAASDTYGIKPLVDGALATLSEKQLENGSFGNANSDAMAIIGLCALGINPDTDARFVKESGSLLDGLLSYLTADGGFGYMDAGERNAFATEQAFRALIAAAGTMSSGGAYNVYDFSAKEAKSISAVGGGGLASPSNPTGEDTVTVWFTLLGTGGKTWLSKRAVTIADDAKVYHVLKNVLDSEGYTCEGAESGYVGRITRSNGTSAGQYDSGTNSGWLYKVDGEMPSEGLLSFTVYDGADIVWYYTDDWTHDSLAGKYASGLSSVSVETETVEKPMADYAPEPTAAYLINAVKNQSVGDVGGEWTMLALSRGGFADDARMKSYYDALGEKLVSENGVLHTRKYTEYARAALALTSIGVRATDVFGYNLIAPLEDFDKVTAQGINGAIFALIAAESGGYELSARDRYIEYILEKQLDDGGFALAGEAAECDVTAMALTALSAYRDKTEVAEAITRAVGCLSKMQAKTGAFSSGGIENAESTAQAVIAMCALGIAEDDSRFVKGGKTAADALLSFRNDDNGFGHTRDGDTDMLATEQALCALVSISRAEEKKPSVYAMSDVKLGAFSDTYFNKYADAIAALAESGVINGVGANRFAPNKSMTRAEFAAITVRGLKKPVQTTGAFRDVGASSWYNGYVGAAVELGIVKGVSGDSFMPERSITRAEALTMVARAAVALGVPESTDETALARYTDSDELPQWARAGAALCAENGLLAAESGELLPNEYVKRDEIAELLYRLLSRIVVK